MRRLKTAFSNSLTTLNIVIHMHFACRWFCGRQRLGMVRQVDMGPSKPPRWCPETVMPTSSRLALQVFFDRQRLEMVRRVEMGLSVSALLWHERINQIFVGTGALLESASGLPLFGGVSKLHFDSYAAAGRGSRANPSYAQSTCVQTPATVSCVQRVHPLWCSAD